MDRDAINERLSAWMDGELEIEQVCRLLSQIKGRFDLLGDWGCYWLIGDTLRGMQGPDLCARIRARLDSEPTVLAPQRQGGIEKQGRFVWAAASIAAVVSITFAGWTVLRSPQQDLPQIAVNPAPEVELAAAPAGEGTMGYLLAHQHFSPSNALQGLAVYARAFSKELPLQDKQMIKRE